MNTKSRYLLDANVFIEAKNRHYKFDLCPGFWDSIIANHQQGNIFSIDRVKQELEAGGDELATWVQSNLSSGCFLSTSASTIVNIYRDVQTWAQSEPQYFTEAKEEFARSTDGWLVAYAKANEYVVVTHEVFEPKIKKKIKIPNVCVAFDVKYIDTFTMLNNLGVKFVLEK